jgi:hypothetical protein
MNTAQINYPSEELLGDQYLPELAKEFTSQVIKRTVPQSRYETALDDDIALGRIYTRLQVDVPEEVVEPGLPELSLNPSGNTLLSAAVLSYGITTLGNVSSGNTSVRLPQPVTGKRLVLINSGNSIIMVFPSNAGGTINGLGPSQPLILPNDSQPYEFVCVKNPNPGAWVISAPATAQYDSGEITIPSITPSTGVNNINAVDTINSNLVSGIGTSSFWVYDGVNKPQIITSQLMGANGFETYYALNPLPGWNAITKVKVYTNFGNTPHPGGANPIEVRLAYAGMFNQYQIGSTREEDLVQWGGGAQGSPMSGTLIGAGNFALTQSIGVSSLPYGGTSPNIGDPGTLFRELNFGYAFMTNPLNTRVGTFYVGQLPSLDPQANQSILYDTYYTGAFYLAVSLQNISGTVTNFKLRFFIEHT